MAAGRGVGGVPWRHRALACVLVLALAAGVPSAGTLAAGQSEGGFVAGVEDLPLMPGLREVTEAGVVFPSPAGRIVEALAVGPAAPEEVRAFYAAALPQLGWKALDTWRYEREGEVLKIEVGGGGDTITVRFAISPR